MAKSKSFSYALCHLVLVFVNIYFFGKMHYYDNEKLSWSKRAAEEPEKIASMSCSGHGRAYIDGYISVDGQPICECYSCYTGNDCSLFSPNCSADAERWAIVRDINLYRRMMEFIGLAKMGTSKDVQLRVLTLPKVVAQVDGKQLFNFAQQILRDRWEKLSHIFSITKRVSLQKVPTQYCTFLERAREPSPAYAWVECKRKEDKNSEEVFRVAKIIGCPGRKFLAEDRYVRLSLLKSQHDFDMLIHRLKELVSQEYEASAQAMSSF